jgi:primosomal protein N' (replication factor Y) (superfamily II helicase)
VRAPTVASVIAKVEPLTPARALQGPFDYRLPQAMEDVGVGSVLVVPFGRRRLLGVVVDVAERSEVPPERLVEPLAALEGGVPAELVRLGLWVAEEYCSTRARGLSLVLAPGTGTGPRARLRERRALVASLTPAGRAALGECKGERPVAARLGMRQRALLAALEPQPLTAAAASRAAGSGNAALRRLEARGLVQLERLPVGRRPELRAVGARHPGEPELTAAQTNALEAIVGRLDAGGGRLLLHGATGSGKTEVYLRAVGAAFERGRSAIVLVPEIALTPQTASRFAERFGDRVAVLHSKLGAGERFDEWLRLRRGEASVCVGPRSAVFAPLADIGLIVIDEEHDPSYKQEGDPRYDARLVAERRAEQAGAVLVCGTATPRPESYHALPRLELPERVDGRALPPVELVQELGAPGGLHERTREGLGEVRRSEGKAIVLLNRRGWSNFLSCRSCGRVWGCPRCDVTLVLHRGAGRLACHHCGHGEAAPSSCPDCGSISVARHGSGTERLERELVELLDPLPVFRLDSDTSTGRGSVARLLSRFERARAGVLLGTQMVAKGHDFPDVTLSVVVDADATLRFPDFRAEERTFALVAQLAGRCGRGPAGGRVIVQALEPGARALRHAAAHDAHGFLAGELERRRALRYPPFATLIRIVCSSHEPGPELEAAMRLRELAAGRQARDADCSLVGPAPLFRLKGRARVQLLLKTADRGAGIAVVREAIAAAGGELGRSGVSLAVDVDPQ